MGWLSTWFKEHKVSTHTLALAIGALAVLVETDTHIRDVLLKDLNIHPKIISSLGALGAILLAYRQPKKPNGSPSSLASPPSTLPPTSPVSEPRKDK